VFDVHRHAPNGQDLLKQRVHEIDSLHRALIPNYKSPRVGGDVQLLEFEVRLDKGQPLYTTKMKNYFNTQYTVNMGVGHPGDGFSFILDTGSGTTLLNERRCKTRGCKTRKSFDSKSSPHYSPFGKIIKIAYAKGGVTIELAKDHFYFEDLEIPNQEFGVILNEDGLFQSASYDGIIGFSYPALSDNTKPFFDRVIEMRVLPADVFSLYMSRDENFHKSQLFLGGWDETLMLGPIHYHPVVKKTWWTVSLDKVLLNGIDSGLCNPTIDCTIIMDTGSSLMATPPWALNPLLSQINRFSDCKNVQRFPVITFVINGVGYTLEPFEYVLTDMSLIDYRKDVNRYKQLNDLDCTFGFSIFDVGKGNNVWIAGDLFLTKYYTIYDRDNDRIGLALARTP
jgi:cathepsin D